MFREVRARIGTGRQRSTELRRPVEPATPECRPRPPASGHRRAGRIARIPRDALDVESALVGGAAGRLGQFGDTGAAASRESGHRLGSQVALGAVAHPDQAVMTGLLLDRQRGRHHQDDLAVDVEAGEPSGRRARGAAGPSTVAARSVPDWLPVGSTTNSEQGRRIVVVGEHEPSRRPPGRRRRR